MMKDIQEIINFVNQNGIQWKPGKLQIHLEKRKKQKQIPQNWIEQDYNNFILGIINNPKCEVYRYHLETFTQDYFVFGLPNWIAIIGEDCIIETAFEIDRESYYDYLNPKRGYIRVK